MLCWKGNFNKKHELVCEPEPALTVVIFGATGDLAKKKLYPALYQLMFGCPDAPLLPQSAHIVGYGRSHVELNEFIRKQCENVKGEQKDKFIARCSFFSGAYDQEKSYKKLGENLSILEAGCAANRLFFLSVPPTVFENICKNIKAGATAPHGWTRLLIEKPFGRDSVSFKALDATTSSAFAEDQLFRIDHYLGKEVVLNLFSLRFGNQFFEGMWNKHHIASVQIVFKEDLGTEGRGGYFDSSGIIRDIIQNHLMQVFLWLAMEPPKLLDRASIAHEKCKLLKAIHPVAMKDCFLGQFGPNAWTVNGVTHSEPGYLEDKTVPEGSKTATFAAVVLRVDNDRWCGVPFLFRAGKGLDERMAEVRMTFKPKDFNELVPGAAPNELVMRIQPDEAVYLKVMNKKPGWKQSSAAPVVLDMSYSKTFPNSYVADGYERMLLNAYNGDGSLFVGSEELTEAWRIFTPLLHEIDEAKTNPVIYPFGVRSPAGFDEFAARYGITMGDNWQEFLALHANKHNTLKEVFDRLDKNNDGRLDSVEIRELARHFYDGREPTEKQVATILQRLDGNGDGSLTFAELQEAVQQIASYCCERRDTNHTGMEDWD